MMFELPEKCLRGYKDCQPLSLIVSEGEISFICCGENDGSTRKFNQDKYTFCFKSPHVDEETHNDKRDLIHVVSVIAGALAIIEEGDSESYHLVKDEPEWKCPECGQEGDYIEIRKPIDHGVDTCPQCGTEVKCIDHV